MAMVNFLTTLIAISMSIVGKVELDQPYELVLGTLYLIHKLVRNNVYGLQIQQKRDFVEEHLLRSHHQTALWYQSMSLSNHMRLPPTVLLQTTLMRKKICVPVITPEFRLIHTIVKNLSIVGRVKLVKSLFSVKPLAKLNTFTCLILMKMCFF